MKIGILGGAFDPIHIDHMKMAAGVLEAGLVDSVDIMPCNEHNLGKDLVSTEHRLNMVCLACATQEATYLNAAEVRLNHDGKTFDIFKNYLLKDSTNQHFLIIGLDNARKIELWHRWEELLKLIPIIVIRRMGEFEPEKEEWFMQAPHIYLDLGGKLGKLSSTFIRERIKSQSIESSKPFLHSDVHAYIAKHKLYE